MQLGRGHQSDFVVVRLRDDSGLGWCACTEDGGNEPIKRVKSTALGNGVKDEV